MAPNEMLALAEGWQAATTSRVYLQLVPAEVEVWVIDAHAQLHALAALAEDWSSYGERPNAIALQRARELVDRLAPTGRAPHRIAPIADGGIEMRFESDQRQARLEFTNDGAVVLVTRANAEADAGYTEVDPLHAIARLDEFLGG